jgi:predicted nucleic acid-binding protein
MFFTPDSARSSRIACRQVIQAILFRVLASDATLDELGGVLKDAKALARHGKSSREIDAFCAKIRREGDVISGGNVALPKMVRDVTDRKFLELALAGDVDYLITNDRRHLLSLKKIGRTQIVTPHKFMLALSLKPRA